MFHDSGLELPRSFAVVRVVEEYAETATARGVALPRQLAPALDLAREIEAACPARPSIARWAATTTC